MLVMTFMNLFPPVGNALKLYVWFGRSVNDALLDIRIGGFRVYPA
jgi:hypothetical protein